MESDDLRPPRAFAALRAALTANPSWRGGGVIVHSLHSLHSLNSLNSLNSLKSRVPYFASTSYKEALHWMYTVRVVVRYACNSPDVGGAKREKDEEKSRRVHNRGPMTCED